MKKHDIVMNQRRKYSYSGSYKLSDESSEIDEFITKEDFKMHFKEEP